MRPRIRAGAGQDPEHEWSERHEQHSQNVVQVNPCPDRKGMSNRTVSKRFGLNPTMSVPIAIAITASTLPKVTSA